MELRKRFKEETGKKLESTMTFECDEDATEVEIDVWNDSYIFWLEKQLTNNIVEQGEFQKCPKCDGQGTVSKPPYIAGDVYEWSSSACSFTCEVCNGNKIILRPITP